MLERTKKFPIDKTELHVIVPVGKQMEILSYIRSLGGDVIEPSDSDIQEIPSDSLHLAEAFRELENEENLPGLMLQGARKRLRMKQRDLASKTGIPQPHISQMEKGKRVISKQNARKFANVFEVGYRVFL